VLFEVWAPTQSEIEITSVLCSTCGFVCYLPRPDEADITAKYEFLGTLNSPVDPLKSQHANGQEQQSLLERATALFDVLSPLLSENESISILDVGGGRGALLSPFAEAGHRCFLLDYTKDCIDGVTRLGATLTDLPPESKFNVIVCSHVLEHVADPCAMLSRLSQHLTQGGIVYLELPLEIWRRAPLQAEPVTHINFFTEKTARILAEQCSLSVRSSRTFSYSHASGSRALATFLLLQRDVKSVGRLPLAEGYREVRSLLKPSLIRRIRHRMMKKRRLI
jgi:SAM-dependent methyltransferase